MVGAFPLFPFSREVPMVQETPKRRPGRPIKPVEPVKQVEHVEQVEPVVKKSKFPDDVRIGMDADEYAKFITFPDGHEYKVDKGVIVERIR
jgi:hypothetical protein